MTEKSYGTIWVCLCCLLTHANGECCDSDEHGGDSRVPLANIGYPQSVTMGMFLNEHDENCPRRTTDIDTAAEMECDCEHNSYSTSSCEGCGSYLHGERFAMTLWESQ